MTSSFARQGNSPQEISGEMPMSLLEGLPGIMGMRRQRGRHEAPRSSCKHRRARVFTTAGLERYICPKCGYVRIRYLHPVLDDNYIYPYRTEV